MTKEKFREQLKTNLNDGLITDSTFDLIMQVAELLCSDVIMIKDLEHLLELNLNKEYVEAEASFWKEYHELEKPFIVNYEEEFIRINSSGKTIDNTLNILEYYTKIGANSFFNIVKEINENTEKNKICYYEKERELWISYNLKCLSFITSKSFRLPPFEKFCRLAVSLGSSG